jgi:hypothetical protein
MPDEEAKRPAAVHTKNKDHLAPKKSEQAHFSNNELIM